MAQHFRGLTNDLTTGLPILTEVVTTMDGWLWVERLPQLRQGKAIPVELIFLPPWDEEVTPEEPT